MSELALISDSWVLNSERSAKAGGTIPKILYTKGAGRREGAGDPRCPKGAILMEMLDSLIGAQRMQRLLREMVRKFQFGTIDTAEFLALLEETLSRDGSGVSGLLEKSRERETSWEMSRKGRAPRELLRPPSPKSYR